MLTLKLISEETERVIQGLEKKHFKGAREAIENVIAVDKHRRETQQTLDFNLSEAKKMAAQIGMLMKQGKKDEAEKIKVSVAEMKEKIIKQIKVSGKGLVKDANRGRTNHLTLPDSKYPLRRGTRGSSC